MLVVGVIIIIQLKLSTTTITTTTITTMLEGSNNVNNNRTNYTSSTSSSSSSKNSSSTTSPSTTSTTVDTTTKTNSTEFENKTTTSTVDGSTSSMTSTTTSTITSSTTSFIGVKEIGNNNYHFIYSEDDLSDPDKYDYYDFHHDLGGGTPAAGAASSSSSQAMSSSSLSYDSSGNFAANSTRSSVPHIIHFIWISLGLGLNTTSTTSSNNNNPPPMDVINTWKKNHPSEGLGNNNSTSNWKIVIWNNTMVVNEFPKLTTNLLRYMKHASGVSNILRYAILQKYGGIYFDTDILSIQSIGSLIEDETLFKHTGFTVCEEPFHSTPLPKKHPSKSTNQLLQQKNCNMACNAVIAVPKNHIVTSIVLHMAIPNTIQMIRNSSFHIKYPNIASGPFRWTDAVKQLLQLQQQQQTQQQTKTNNNNNNNFVVDVPILKSRTFYPCHYHSKDKDCNIEYYQNEPYVFGMHTWTGSWLKQG